MEGAAERRVVSPSPYQLRSTTVPSNASRSSDRWSPAEVALVWTTRSRPPGASSGSAKPTPSAAATLRPAGVDVDERDVGAGEPAEQPATQQPTIPGADDRHPVPDERGRVPERVDGGLDGAGEHGPVRRHSSGTTVSASTRDDVRGLVRVEAEHRAADQRPLGPSSTTPTLR